MSKPNAPWDGAAVLSALVFPSLVTWLYFVVFADRPEQVKLAFGAGKLIQFAFPLVWVWLICREPVRPGRPTGRGMAVGIGFGLLVLALMLGLYSLWLKPGGLFDERVVEEIRSKLVGFHVDTVWKYAGLGLFYSVVHSLLEEYYWRWFVFGRLRGLLGSVGGAVAISSLGFMAHHVIVLAVYFGLFSPMTWIFSLGVAVGGAVWAGLYQRSGSLYGPWISHLLVDAAIFLIGFDLVRGILE